MLFRRQSHDGSQWVSVIQDGAMLHAVQVAHKADERPRVISLWQGEASTLEAGLRNLRTSPMMKKGGSLIGVLDRATYRMQAGDAPDVPREDWRDAMRWQLKEQMDFPIEDAVLDVLEVPNSTQLRQNTAVMAFVVPREEYTKIELAADDVGLGWAALDVPETALRNLCALAEDGEKAHALMTFGDNYGMLVITFKGELLMARHIEVSVSAVTGNDEARGAALSRAALEILRTIDTFERMHSQVALSALHVALPPGCGPDTIEMLADLIYVPLQALELSAWFDLEALGPQGERINTNATFNELCALGATMRAVPALKERQQLQLLDARSVLGQSPTWGAVLGVRLAGGVIAVGVVAGLGLSAAATAYNHQSGSIESEANTLRAADAAQPIPAAVKELDVLRQKEAQQRQMQEALQGGMAWASQGYSDYLMALGRQLHPGVWITGLVVHGDGRDIVLIGRTNDAATLPSYLQKLGLEDRFKGRRFAQFDVTEVGQDASQGSAANDVVQFTLRSVAANEGRKDRPLGTTTQDALRSVEQNKDASREAPKK
jgi:MSHA biogenesis protein MshI